MFNGVPLRRVRGIVRHYYVNMEVFGKLNQLLLEKPAGTAVGTSTITEQHDGSCMWIDALEHTIPVVLEVVAGELGCVMTYSEAHVSSILLNIVDDIGNDFTACKGGEVMILASRRPVAVYLSASSEWADHLFLLRVYVKKKMPGLLIVCFQTFDNKLFRSLHSSNKFSVIFLIPSKMLHSKKKLSFHSNKAIIENTVGDYQEFENHRNSCRSSRIDQCQ